MALVLCSTITSLPAPFFVHARRTISCPSTVAVALVGSAGFDGAICTIPAQLVAMRTSSKYVFPGVPSEDPAPADSQTVLTQPTSLLLL